MDLTPSPYGRVIIVLIVWIACGVLTFGITFGYFQREFPLLAEEGGHSDRMLALLFAAFGPIALITTFFLSGCLKHGIKFK